MLSTRFWLYCFFVFWIPYSAEAQGKSIIMSKDSSIYPLGYRVSILSYAGNSLPLEKILLPEFQNRFEPSKQESPNHGFSSLNYWFTFQIEGTKQAVDKKVWLFQMKNPNIDTLEVYFLNEKNEILKRYITGDRLTFDKRPIKYYKFSFPIPFEQSEKINVYVHARGFYSKMHDMLLVEETLLFEDSQYGLAFAIFLNTILIALVLYNLLLYISLKDISYFYYIVYLFCVVTHLVATTGLGYQFIYPDYTTFANYVANGSATLSGSFALYFTYHFLKIKELLPSWTVKLLNGMAWYGFAVFIWLLIAVWRPWYIPYIMTAFAIQLLATLVFLMVLAVWTLKKGSRAARFFLAAWSVLFVGATLSIVRVIGLEISAFFSDYGVQIGTSLEALLLSFGLADRIKVMEKEKRQAQQETIQALQKNEEIIRQQNQILEQKVKERTIELAEANDELATFNEELNQTNEELQTTLEIVNQQKQDIEDKNQAILDSILYAKRIQEAILPTQEYFQQHLKESFVFFKPRDIVSGDFYFLAERQEHIVIAAVDCTGHGVPGAFMSMIGKELLDQIVLEREILEADIILNELHKGIRKALKQQDSNNRDGMDLSMLVIPKGGSYVQFAGAKNPLVYIQNGTVHKIKADSVGIGGEQREQERIFTKHIIDLSQPTCFYLFTDGFQDQFGGMADKKFTLAQLKQTFLEIHLKSMEEQQKILAQTFEDWVGKSKQIDDVLVVGIRL